jgi:hypothetical protein
MKREYIGAFVEGASSIQQELMAIRQVQFDQNMQSPKRCSVEEYHIKFKRCLNLHPADQPYSFDLAATFWSNLAYDIQKSGVAEEFHPPQKVDGETNGQALECLQITKKQAKSFEHQIQNIQDQVNHSQNVAIHGISQA